jgi:hypothetical protein
MLLYCATRPWSITELSRLQSSIDKAYRYIWMDKKGGPGLKQLEAKGVNMFGVRKELGVDSIRWKVEKRLLERLGHVLRMPGERLAKKVVLGYYPRETESTPKRRQTTIFFWKRLLREMNVDPDCAEVLTEDRFKWRDMVKKRQKYVRNWEENMGFRHRGNNIKKPPRSQFELPDRGAKSFVCEWDGCSNKFLTQGETKMHQIRTHRKGRMKTFECRKCHRTVLDNAGSKTSREKECQRAPRGVCPYCLEKVGIQNGLA